jgi:hypothetical protein
MAYRLSTMGTAKTPSLDVKTTQTIPEKSKETNVGGVLGGVGYAAEKAAVGFVQGLEGIVDYTAGGLAKLFGADNWAEEQFKNDWFGDWYSHPDEWYNPSGSFAKGVGDVAGGIGSSLPGLAAGAAAAGITVATGGTAAIPIAGIASAATAGLAAAGTSTKEAYKETGNLTGKEFAYGAISGGIEGAVEGVTTALTMGTGAIAKNIGKAFAKETAGTVAKKGILKSLAGSFAGEAFEEGLAEWLDPYVARATYNEDAENASAQEIAYSAFIGGLAGLFMTGADISVNAANSFQKGTNLVNRGLAGEVMALSDELSSFEDENGTGNEAFEILSDTYKKLRDSLAATDGRVMTITQKKLLGDLQRQNTAAVFQPLMVRSAANIVQNADAVAERLNAYGYTDAKGKPITFTADQIREGIDASDRRSFEKALKTNNVLRGLAAMDVAGRMTMDTRKFADAVLAGEDLASKADLNRFAENATAEEIEAVSAALGIDDWNTLTYDSFREKVGEFVNSGRMREFSKGAPETSGAAMPMPEAIALEDGHTGEYTDGTRQFAISREGENYTVYDRSENKRTKGISRDELNKLLADYSASKAEAQIDRKAVKRVTPREEIDAWARDNVKQYASLADTAKTAVRQVIRAARAHGLTEADVKMYATVSAHCGLDITFSKALCKVGDTYADGFYDPSKNRIVVNPEAKRSAEKILLHELDHAVRTGIRKDGGTEVFADAVFGISDEDAQKITARYKNIKSDVSKTELIFDEANAYFAETFFANKNVLESLTEKVPTLKERILSFLEGARTDYTGEPRLEGAAKRYYKQYKKMFDEFAERNAGRNSEEGTAGAVRYALSINGSDIPVEIEESKDLIAIHNLTEENLIDTLKIGGFPMPSLAIIRANQEHSKYGEISVIFGRETIDPKSSKYNKVYGSDAWTPTYPKIEYQANSKISKKIKDKYYELADKYGYDDVRPMYDYATDIEEKLNRFKGESGLLNELYDNSKMMQVFLLDSGRGKVDTVKKEIKTELSPIEIQTNEFIINELGKSIIEEIRPPKGVAPFGYKKMYFAKYEEKIKSAFKKLLVDVYNLTPDIAEAGLANFKTADFISKIQNAYTYLRDGAVTITTEPDLQATEKAIRAAADNQSYRDWINSIFMGIEKTSGIRNSLDYYDEEGNPRTWKQLHFENTVNNVVKVMRKQNETGGNAIFGGNAIWGVSAKEYKSVEDVKSDKKRLQMIPEENYKKMSEELGARFERIARSIIAENENNIYIALDDAMQLISDSVRVCKTKSSMLKFLKEYNNKVTLKTVDDIFELVRDISNMPTGYFEAKPRRAVGFDEIKMVELPQTVSENLKNELIKRNIPFEIYGETDAERAEAIRNLSGVRFALPMDDEALDEMLEDMRENGVVFDPEGIIMKGAPVVPDSPRAKIHTRARAYMVFEQMADNNLLSNKSRREFFDLIYKAMNSFESYTEKQSFAREAAEFYVARLLTEAKTENPAVRPAHRRLSWLNIGVGKLSFSPSDIAEMRAVLDESEFRKIFGRWGKKTSGTPNYMLDMFINEVSSTIPGMYSIGRKHPVDALLELDKMYEEARRTITMDKYISAYWDSTDDDIAAMVQSAQDAIVNGFDAQDKAIIEEKLENTVKLAEGYKNDFEQLSGTMRYRGYIASRVEKLVEMKKGVFQNASLYKDDTFDKIVSKLASIEWRKTLSMTKVKNVMQDIANWYTTKNALLGYVDEKNPGYYNKEIAENIAELAAFDGGLTAENLKSLDEILGYLTRFIETYNKVYINGKWVDAIPMAKEYVNTVKAGTPMGDNAVFKLMRKYLEGFGDIESVVRYYDRYRKGGFFTESFQRLREAAIGAEAQQHRIMREYEAFMQKNKKYLREAEKQTVDFAGQKLPKMEAISLYMTMKREQAHKGLIISGFKYKDADGKYVNVGGFAPEALNDLAGDKEKSRLAAVSLIAARQKELYEIFSDTDKEYIAILERGYNTETRKLKADRDMDRYGFTNVMNDYYYPLRRANVAKSVDTSLSAELDRVSNASFNKDVVKGAAGKLFIQNADTLYRNHVRAVCNYAMLSPAIESFNKLYNMDISGNPNDPVSVKTASENVWTNAYDYFRDLIGDIQGLPRTRGESMELFGKFRGGFAKFQLGANPKTVATQLSSILASTSILDVDSILASAKILGSGVNDVDKYCVLAELRNAENTAAMAQGVLTAGKRVKYKIDAVSDVLMKPISMMDRFVIKRLFAACQVQVAKNGGPKTGTEQNRVEAGKLLEKVIIETQQNSFATERSAAMRSGNEIIKTFTMFSSDAMKVTARVIDAFGEITALRAQLKSADAETKKAIKAQLKVASAKFGKSSGAMVMAAVYSMLIAQAFRWLYDKDKDDDETTLGIMAADFLGSMVGGLPIIKEFTQRLTDGFGVENYTLSMFNDLLDSTARIFNLTGDILKGKYTEQDINSALKNSAYTLGQFSGLPIRNIYNTLYGLTKRTLPNVAYKVDEWFYEKNYQSDLYRAVEEGDVRMADMLLSLATKERVGEVWSDKVHAEMLRLTTAEYKILPRSVGKVISVDGKEYEMSEEERDMVREAYAGAMKKLDSLLSNESYLHFEDEQKANTIDKFYDICYDMAIADVFGIDRGNAALVAGIVGADTVAILSAITAGIESDKDKEGNTVSGSKRKKVVKAINSLAVSADQKLLLLAMKGYSTNNGDVRGLTSDAAKKRLLRYLNSLRGISAVTRSALAEMCGFNVKNGKISLKKS